MLQWSNRSLKYNLASFSDYSFVRGCLFLASGLKLYAKCGRILSIAGFLQIALKYNKKFSTQFYLAVQSFSFLTEGFCYLKNFWEKIFNCGGLKSVFVSFWGGSNDVLFEGVTHLCFMVSYCFWDLDFYWYFNPE